VKSSNQVSATLGADSVKSGLMAGLIGIIAVVIFMLIYYKMSGFLANIALVFNVGFILPCSQPLAEPSPCPVSLVSF